MADKRSDSTRPGRAPRRYSAREILGVVVLLLVLIFAMINLESVTVDFVVFQVTVPVFFVVTVPTVLGFGVGMLFQRGRKPRPSG